jgi:autotransporter translocation and assembly factor TamB
MKLLKLVFILFLLLLLLIGTVIFIIGTHYGTSIVLKWGEKFIPGELSIQTISGSIWQQNLSLDNIEYKFGHHTIKVQNVSLNWTYNYSDKFNINLQQIVFNNITSSEHNGNISIHGQGKVTNNNYQLDVYKLAGKINNVNLDGNFSVKYIDNLYYINNTRIILGNNQIVVAEEDHKNLNFFVNLDKLEQIMPKMSGNLSIKGIITNYTYQPTLKLNAISNGIFGNNFKLNDGKLSLSLELYANNKYNLNINLNNLFYKEQQFKLIAIKSSGDAINNTSNFNLNSPEFSFITNIHTNFNNKLLLVFANIINPITGKITLTDTVLQLKSESGKSNLKIDSSIIDLNISKEKIAGVFNINFSPKNKIVAAIELIEQQLQVKLSSHFADLSIIENVFPDNISNVSGAFSSETYISNNLNTNNNLLINTKTHLDNFRANLFNLGININPFNLSVTNSRNHELKITGIGMTSGSSSNFTINGLINYKNLQSLKLVLKGQNIKLINNGKYNISASPDLTVSINNKNKIDLSGNIFVNSANIILAEEDKNAPVISSDVIFVEKHPKISTEEKLFKSLAYDLAPNINIRMRNNINFSGFGINADVTGNLNITKKHPNYLGYGRITIKKGTYKLPGKILVIKRGRFIYTPGTLLANPSLDIKLSNKKESIDEFNVEKEQFLYIQGTLHAPILVNSGLLTGNAATNQIFNSSTSMFTEKFQEKLGLEEFGLADNAKNENADDSVLENKQFVVGKKISNRLYLQYIKDIVDTDNTIRLKFKLLQNFSIGVESGTYGSGSDLYFSKETD